MPTFADYASMIRDQFLPSFGEISEDDIHACHLCDIPVPIAIELIAESMLLPYRDAIVMAEMRLMQAGLMVA